MDKIDISKLTFKNGEGEKNTLLSHKIGVPVYHINTTHAFNRFMGYARFIYSSVGTVLYRGQNKLYPELRPSGLRGIHVPVSDKVITDIREDEGFRNFFSLNQKEIKGWEQYECVLIEAILQHYGAHTYCMDFVDNHWCALWFGLYEFSQNHYHRRSDNGNLYIYLYVANTVGPCVRGMYLGAGTITIDLRKALPSTFQRPASQHGWIVRNRDSREDTLNNALIAVVEVNVSDASRWLGEGMLLTEENFFPSFCDDQGYSVLLERQNRSGLPSRSKKYAKLLPMDTIQNYHYSDLIHSDTSTESIKHFLTQRIVIIQVTILWLIWLLGFGVMAGKRKLVFLSTSGTEKTP